jgi:hypothetical protein
MRVKYFYLLAALLLVPALLIAADLSTGRVVTLDVPDGDSVAIQVPAGWGVDRLQSDPARPLSIRIHPVDRSASLQITFFPDKFGNLSAQNAVEDAVHKSSQRYVAGSVEKRSVVHNMWSKAGPSAIAEFTDARYLAKNPPVGEFKLVGTGIVHLGNSMAAFTLMGHGAEDPSYVTAKQVLTDGITVHGKSDVASGKTYRR